LRWKAGPTHGDRMAFQCDRTRQNVLVAAGYTVLRYTADDIAHRLPGVVAEVAGVVDTCRRRAG
jgi:very-short-patch-repair endonuclease